MRKEEDYYQEIEDWLKVYLEEKYKGYSIETTHKTARQYLDVVLRSMGIRCDVAIGLSIKIDVVGILRKGDEIKYVFVEVKEGELTLKDLGQLWGYTQLIDPIESFLMSPKGIGGLDHLFNTLRREDLLKYGKKKEKLMKIVKWNETTKSIDLRKAIPRDQF